MLPDGRVHSAALLAIFKRCNTEKYKCIFVDTCDMKLPLLTAQKLHFFVAFRVYPINVIRIYEAGYAKAKSYDPLHM